MPENMFGTGEYKGRNGITYPVPSWKLLGFFVCPTIKFASGSERLFRVSSSAEQVPGRFFSLTAYRTRREAERHSNVMQFGNGILCQTQFSIVKDTPMWIGKVHPGDFAGQLGTVDGSQVFIDKEYLSLLTKVREIAIKDDMDGAFVIDNPDKGQLDS